MRNIFRLSAFLMLLSLAVSCDPLGDKDEDGISVSLRNSSAGKAKGSTFVVVKASGEWMLSIDFGEAEPWANFGAEGTEMTVSGKGNKGNVILNYEQNASGAERTLRLVLASGSSEVSCTFIQDAVEPSDPTEVTKDGGYADASPFGWLELPETKSGDGLKYIWHNMTVNSRQQRNYSLYWSQDDYLSIWVAYPLNSGLTGSGSRPKPEPWAFDPFMPSSLQPSVVYGGYGRSGYDRGHQIPSADRYIGNSNAQTYYATNVTPQLSGFNQEIWVSLENQVRDWSKKADTLYVVTGCIVGSGCKSLTDRGGHSVTIPSSYYKAMLRYSATSGYSGCAVWLNHVARTGSISRSDMMSIDALEEKLGIDLFVNLPKKVGDAKAAEIEAKAPSENVWPI